MHAKVGQWNALQMSHWWPKSEDMAGFFFFLFLFDLRLWDWNWTWGYSRPVFAHHGTSSHKPALQRPRWSHSSRSSVSVWQAFHEIQSGTNWSLNLSALTFIFILFELAFESSLCFRRDRICFSRTRFSSKPSPRTCHHVSARKDSSTSMR